MPQTTTRTNLPLTGVLFYVPPGIFLRGRFFTAGLLGLHLFDLRASVVVIVHHVVAKEEFAIMKVRRQFRCKEHGE